MERTEKDQSQDVLLKQTNNISEEGITKPKKQLKRVKRRDEGIVRKKGFCKSLRASAKGVKMPESEGELGPRRNMMYASTLRSSKVKKATATNRSRRERRETIN